MTGCAGEVWAVPYSGPQNVHLVCLFLAALHTADSPTKNIISKLLMHMYGIVRLQSSISCGY